MHWCALFIKKCLCVDVAVTQRIYKHETAGAFSTVRDARGVITKSCPPHFARGKNVPCKQLANT